MRHGPRRSGPRGRHRRRANRSGLRRWFRLQRGRPVGWPELPDFWIRLPSVGDGEVDETLDERYRKLLDALPTRWAAWVSDQPLRWRCGRFSSAELERRAYRHWQHMANYRRLFVKPPPRQSDVATPRLKRWAVLYLRHECTNYDALLSQGRRDSGPEWPVVVAALRVRTLLLIAERYPALAVSCRQAMGEPLSDVWLGWPAFADTRIGEAPE